MVAEEIFETGVSMTKTVWQKRGDNISRREVKRMIATGQPLERVDGKDATNGS
jgi:hypothetical protein